MLILPARTMPIKNAQFPIRNRWGVSLKLEVRNIAKSLPLYHEEVKLDPHVTGRTNTGEIVPINNFGKWLFGVPGYMSNMIVESFEENIAFCLPDVPQAMELISQAVEILSEKE